MEDAGEREIEEILEILPAAIVKPWGVTVQVLEVKSRETD